MATMMLPALYFLSVILCLLVTRLTRSYSDDPVSKRDSFLLCFIPFLNIIMMMLYILFYIHYEWVENPHTKLDSFISKILK